MTTTEAKIGAAGGIAYGVISLVAWQLWACPSFPHIPEFPRLSASAATWAHWYVQHQDVKRLAGSLWALSVLPMVFFLSTIYTALRGAEGGRGYALVTRDVESWPMANRGSTQPVRVLSIPKTVRHILRMNKMAVGDLDIYPGTV